MMEVPPPHEGMPEEVKKLYLEGVRFFNTNPLVAQSLLYAALQKMLLILEVVDPSDVVRSITLLHDEKLSNGFGQDQLQRLFMSEEQMKSYAYFDKYSDLSSLSAEELRDTRGFVLLNELIANTSHYNEEYKEKIFERFFQDFNIYVNMAGIQKGFDFVFRGENKSYGSSSLVSGIARHPFGDTNEDEALSSENPFDRISYLNQENKLLKPYVKAASEILGVGTKTKDNAEWIISAQHYGVPTRLLDWTTNPLVALFFAVEKEDKLISEISKNWDDGILYLADDVYICNDLDEIDFEKGELKWAADSDVGHIPKYNDFNLIFLKPEYLDVRYKNQSTVLMYPRKPFESRETFKGSITALVIPMEIKHHIRVYLRQIGITNDFIYPSLDGASRAAIVKVLDSKGVRIGKFA